MLMKEENDIDTYPHKHLLGIEGLSPPSIKYLLKLSENYAHHLIKKSKKLDLLKNKTCINLFFENSTRTRTSFELAGKKLGADILNISLGSSSIKKGETLVDTAMTLNAMQPDIIVVRHNDAGAVKLLSEKVNCCVINAGDGPHEHPTQALLDALTILRTPFRHFIFLLIIMPILIPGISLLIPLYKLVKELGLMNSYLGLILIHSTGMLTLGVFLMRNAFMSIPTSLREVALLEGSSELRIMFTVMLPLAIPGLLTLMVFALYGSWNDFILAFLFVNTIDMEMLNVFLMKLTFAGSQFDTFWGLLNAGAIISFVPIIVFYIFLQQYFVRGVTGSAVKE